VEPFTGTSRQPPPVDRVLLDYHNPRHHVAPDPIAQAFCCAACMGIGALFLIATCVIAAAAARAWGDWRRFPAGAACTVLSAAGTFASCVAARHHWRANKPRRK
jgi:hypothetical protein